LFKFEGIDFIPVNHTRGDLKMKLSNEVSIVGAGDHGLRLTHPSDCAVYLINGGNGHLALIDAGVGAGTRDILANVESDGYNPKDIETVFLTHSHTDHIGGAKDLRDILSCKVAISAGEASFVENADEETLGLRVAKQAGYYPQDFVVRPCPIDIRVRDGDEFSIGDLTMLAIVVGGHTRAGVLYYLRGKEKTYLFAGDHISYGGLISLQNYENSGSSIEGYRASGKKLASLNLHVDAFLPSHMLITLNRGQTEVDKMIQASQHLMFGGRVYAPERIF
jgi:glyoxylase-like metal-dependent hydrolase (beta-lactamase superfamily II)